jgi:hypothetical protein
MQEPCDTFSPSFKTNTRNLNACLSQRFTPPLSDWPTTIHISSHPVQRFIHFSTSYRSKAIILCSSNVTSWCLSNLRLGMLYNGYVPKHTIIQNDYGSSKIMIIRYLVVIYLQNDSHSIRQMCEKNACLHNKFGPCHADNKLGKSREPYRVGP